ncbi:MAG TPA: metallophosphoesterase, partial [Blastocatellia bacterium]
MRSEIVIAHLSDLHHPTIKEETWARLKSYLVERKPDLILVTGDLTNHPWPWRHIQVRRKLLELVDECQKSRLTDAVAATGTQQPSGTDKQRDVMLRVVPGNHDCAFWGNVGFYFLKWVSFDLVFRGYQQTFFDFSTDKLKLYFFSFNSNPFIARWAKGAVSRRQLKSFQRKMDELQESQPDSINDAYKVALLHHHPMPIPYDEKLEKYLFLKNAGEFINAMAQNRINLVLHGHKHKPRISSVSLGTTSTSRNVSIVASGSTLKDGEESTCNLITIYDNMRVEVKQAVANPGEDFIEKEVTTYLPSWDTYIEERYAAGKNKLGYEIESLSHTA